MEPKEIKKKKKGERGGSLLPFEVEYIRNNCISKTDQEMADELKKDVTTIAGARRRLGLVKTYRGKIIAVESQKKIMDERQKVRERTQSLNTEYVGQKLNEKERASFFKKELENTIYYDNLKKQFSDEEIGFYLEEWAALCLQFEDIIATEKRQIDELIKNEIIGFRIMRNVKQAENTIAVLIRDTEKLHKNHKMDTDEEAQERDRQLQDMVRIMSAQSQMMTDSYRSNVLLRNDLLDELNARRRDRIDQLRKSGTTFLNLVAAFREKEVRDVQGNYAELMRIAKERKAAEFRAQSKFPDGNKDCILMDEKSEVLDKEIILLSDAISKTVQKYRQLNNTKIFILDDDVRRLQFFQQVFKDQNITISSNAYDAMVNLKNYEYDLICLDYDLNNGDKGEEIAIFIAESRCKGEILIHSMNPEGAERMREILREREDLEVFPFEDIVRGTDWQLKDLQKEEKLEEKKEENGT